MQAVISPEEGEEAQRLWAEYRQATTEAAAALKPDGTDPDFNGERLQRFLEADGRAGKTVARIKEIYGAG